MGTQGEAEEVRGPKGHAHLRKVPTRQVMYFLVTPGDASPEEPWLVTMRIREDVDPTKALMAAFAEIKKDPALFQKWAQDVGFAADAKSLAACAAGIWCDVVRLPSELLRRHGIFEVSFPKQETEIYVKGRDSRIGEDR